MANKDDEDTQSSDVTPTAKSALRKRQQKTINSFFVPLKKKRILCGIGDESVECDGSQANFVEDVDKDHQIKEKEDDASVPTNNKATTSTSASNDAGADCNDLGRHIHNNEISDFTKAALLENPWKPSSDYDFPYSVHNKGGKQVKRFFGKKYLEMYTWLILSDQKRGLFCKYCALFAPRSIHNSVLRNLVTEPLTNFSKLLGKDGSLESHARNKYHVEAMHAAKQFLQSFHAPEHSVINQLNSQRLIQIKENRERLRPILESIIFLGRQNIPLRGHRDDGSILDEANTSTNEGNFRELLKFRITVGDEVLRDHLKNSSARATYIGKNTQNELINCCGEEIKEVILRRVRDSGMYTVIFDETTDISHIEQLSLSIRYVHEGNIKEDFITFEDAYRSVRNEDIGCNGEVKLSGIALGHVVLDILKNLHLDMNRCVGIGTDGCSVMTSTDVGAVKTILDHAMNATYCPCSNHGLNNSMLQSCKVQCVRNSVGVMKEIIAFFHASAKRNVVLKSNLNHQLIGLCQTRWIENHDGVMQFVSSYAKIIESLEEISNWQDTISAPKASSLIASMNDPKFLISLFALNDVLKHTLPLSRLLQKPTLDLAYAMRSVEDTKRVLKIKREKCESEFKRVFQDASKIAEITMLRLNKVQTRRENHPATNAEEYYRRSVYIPLLDYITTDLETRLREENLKGLDLKFLLPPYLFNKECNDDKTKHRNINVLNEDENQDRQNRQNEDDDEAEDEDENKDKEKDENEDKDEDEDQDQDQDDDDKDDDENSKTKTDGGEKKSNDMGDYAFEKVLTLAKRYSTLFSPRLNEFQIETCLAGEMSLWRMHWSNKTKSADCPKSALEIFNDCDKDFLPMIHTLLQILLTYSVSVASAERSFSTLRRAKTWLRSRMGSDRLNGLCLLHSHRDININIDAVIDRFANKGSRRIDFLI